MSRKYDVNDILDNGIDLFRTHGYHKTGINDVLKVSGIPKGSFYNFFDNKQDFGIQAIRRYSDFTLAMMQDYMSDRSRSPLQRLIGFYRAVSDENKLEGLNKGCLMCNLSGEVGASEALIGDCIDAEYVRWISVISECVAEGQEAGEIVQTFSAYEIATFLNNSFAGALTRMKGSRSVEPLEMFLKVAFASIST